MNILITGGGTGGHVNPALAIANTIQQNQPDAKIAYVGTSRGIESRLVPKAGYPLYTVEIQGIRRSLSMENVKTAWLALTSVRKARKIIREFQPDLVIGTGGYVCWPVVRAAAELHVPTALHESNAIAGIAVKALQHHVDRIYLNFAKTGETLHCSPKKILQVGNPVMGGFKTLSRAEAREKLGIPDTCSVVLLSYGGSMGAEKVNDAVLCLMRDFTAKHPEVYHVHATGSIEWEEASEKFRKMGLADCPNIQWKEYIYDMPAYMAAADMTITRAGAMTITELATTGKCALFIPSPNVAENHQYKNAKVLADADAAILLEEKYIGEDGAALTKAVSDLLGAAGEEKRMAMQEKIQAFAVKDANRRIYEDLMELVKRKKRKRK